MSPLAKLDLPWDASAALSAFLETVRLRTAPVSGFSEFFFTESSDQKSKSTVQPEPDSAEFVSALAAGTDSKTIIEIDSTSETKIFGLALAARQIGGRMVSIVRGEKSTEIAAGRRKIAERMGLEKSVVFEEGVDRLKEVENVQFVMWGGEGEEGFLGDLQLAESGALLVRDDYFCRRKTETFSSSDFFSSSKNKNFRSAVLPIGKGLKVTWVAGFSGQLEKKEEAAFPQAAFVPVAA